MSHDDQRANTEATAGRTAAREVAAEWFVRLRDEALTDGEVEAFRRWHAASRDNAEAFQEVERLWTTLDHVAARPDLPLAGDRPLPLGGDRPLPLSGDRPLPRGGDQPLSRRGSAPRRRGRTSDGVRRRKPPRRVLAAASLAAAVGVALLVLPLWGPSADYSTAVGQQRSVELTDGSKLQLNSGSRVSVDYSETNRRITLHSGEVYAEVAHDPDRPFVVDAGLGRATALGTSFAVERRQESFEVIVTSNRVKVSGLQAPPIVVAAGQGLSVTEQAARPLASADVATSLAWRSGRLLFEAAPLGEVFRELDRYRTGRILVLDNSVVEIPVTAAFSTERIDRALETIEQTLPVRLIRLSDRLTLVLAGPAPQNR